MLGERVTIFMAFGAGLLSFFSPCTLPLVPAYIAYVAGIGQTDGEERVVKRWLPMARTLVFTMGFTSVFLLFGFSASYLGRLFAAHKLVLMQVSGAAMALMGLYLMGLLPLGMLGRYLRLPMPGSGKMAGRPDMPSWWGWVGAYLMGVVFAAGWSPCFGPVLASILMMATGFGDPQMGLVLLGVYALGMAVPFILTALFTNVLGRTWQSLERYSPLMMKMGGAVLIATGSLIALNLLAPLGGLLK